MNKRIEKPPFILANTKLAYRKIIKKLAGKDILLANFVNSKTKKMDDLVSAIKACLYALFVWLGIKTEAFFILIVLMSFDSITGVVKALRMGGAFSFSVLLWGFILKLCFLVIPLVVALLGKTLGYDFVIIIHIVISILSVSEAYSILGNIYTAKNKKAIEKVDAVSMLLKSMRTALMNFMKGATSKIEKMG